MTIDNLCIWKKLEKNPESTTFRDVRNNPKSKLYRCQECDGYNNNCKNYVYKTKEGLRYGK